MKLPYDWWIWGPDIQLEGNMDDPQRDYFDIISDYTRPGDNIIICLAEPSWHHDNYDNLHEISVLARKKGAKVCAVLAGDWHHYSRYTNKDLGVQFVTSGGGGAFAHATHHLKDQLDLRWAEKTDRTSRTADPSDSLSFNRMEQGIVKPGDAVDFSIKSYPLDVAGSMDLPSTSVASAPRSRPTGDFDLVSYRHHTSRIYPSRLRSRLLALKNLALPFRSTRFALLVGGIYFFYAWVFQVSAPPIDIKSMAPSGKVTSAQGLEFIKSVFWSSISPQRVVSAAKANPMFFFMLIALWAGLVYYVELGKGVLNSIGKFVIGSTHFLLHLAALLIVNLVAVLPALPLAGLVSMLFQSTGSPGYSLINDVAILASFAVVSILTGGLVGASIMGLYWTVTATLFNMHCGDAFGALGIRDYKHFLRMSFEPGRVTIYPIAVDKVPGRKGWRASTAAERSETPSQIVPKTPLAPHLIETPIVIDAARVKA
jgi:hypothetical protein